LAALPPLREFFEQVDLPEGSFHLGYFRIKDESFFNLFESSRATKPPTIEALMAAFPKRKFILIGDSGEADPEIYWDIARRHPDQVRAIAIRNVTGERADAPRFLEEAFQGLPTDLWLLFDQAEAASAFLASRF